MSLGEREAKESKATTPKVGIKKDVRKGSRIEDCVTSYKERPGYCRSHINIVLYGKGKLQFNNSMY